jgi:hypothetical protein
MMPAVAKISATRTGSGVRRHLEDCAIQDLM